MTLTETSDGQLPVISLLRTRMSALDIKPSELVRRAGYKSIPGGFKALNETIRTGRIPAFLRQGLARALEIEEVDLERVVAQTEALLERRRMWQTMEAERQYRASFRPYIWAHFDRGFPVPSSITVLGGLFQATLIFPEMSADTWPLNREIICRTVQGHFTRWEGRMPIYGKIISYYEVISPSSQARSDIGRPLTTSGMIDDDFGPIPRPHFVRRPRASALSQWLDGLQAKEQ